VRNTKWRVQRGILLIVILAGAKAWGSSFSNRGESLREFDVVSDSEPISVMSTGSSSAGKDVLTIEEKSALTQPQVSVSSNNVETAESGLSCETANPARVYIWENHNVIYATNDISNIPSFLRKVPVKRYIDAGVVHIPDGSRR